MISIFVMTIYPMPMNHTFCTTLKTFFNGFNNAPLSTWHMQLNNSWIYIMLIWKTNQRKSSSTMNLLSCFYNLEYYINFNFYHLLDPMHVHYTKIYMGGHNPMGGTSCHVPWCPPKRFLKKLTIFIWAIIDMDFIVFKYGLCYHLTNDTTLNYQFNIIEWTCVNCDFFKKWAT
jgi:hypothetical protein